MKGIDFLLDLTLALGLLGAAEAGFSLFGGLKFSVLMRKGSRKGGEAVDAPVTLVLPCRGIDPDLHLNLDAFFRLQAARLQILMVTSDRSDPCLPLLERAREAHPDRESKILFAGPAQGRSQKVHNLLHALEDLRHEDEIVAFGDSDIRPGPRWLADLVAPLKNPAVGISTGFRWYLPQKGNFGSILRSVWNAGAVSLMREKNSSFAWGGAMAIRREVFDACKVAERWRNAVSDDLAISQAVRQHGLSICFQPRALSFSHEDCTFSQLLNWTYRQMSILRVYHPTLWGLSLMAQALNASALWLGVFVAALNWGAGDARVAAIAFLVAITYALGCAKAYLRTQAVCELFPENAARIRRGLPWYLLGGPLASLISLLALLRSMATREIEWRGIRYRMHSPDRTEVLENLRDAG